VHPTEKNRPPRAFRILIRLGVVLSVMVLSIPLVLWWALETSAPVAPSTNVNMDVPGPGHAERVRDVWFIWLAGAPEVRGADMQRLVGTSMKKIDATMHATFAEVVPSAALRYLIEVAGRLFGRHLGEDIPEDIQREIVGQMHAYDDAFDDGGGKFARFMAYLALHDLAQTIEHSPLIACSGFAVTGSESASGGTIVGRNFDFEGGRIFDEEKAITVVTPEKGLRFASVAWPGMNGVVTGVNERRVWVSVNAARSDHELARGIPVSLAIRRVLEEAQDAEQAVTMISHMQTRVADLYLVADKTRAFIVEKTPLKSVVRGLRDEKLIVTNHFTDPELRAEKRNLKLETATTSIQRNLRLEQLVMGEKKARTPADAQTILRDRGTPFGGQYPYGDRRALDGYIATHGAFADFGKDVLYVSRSPHLSNTWVGVSLEALFAGRAEIKEELPADEPALEAGRVIGYRAPGM
jgi:isopenicillin-N N-acyltransferase like protein